MKWQLCHCYQVGSVLLSGVFYCRECFIVARYGVKDRAIVLILFIIRLTTGALLWYKYKYLVVTIAIVVFVFVCCVVRI